MLISARPEPAAGTAISHWTIGSRRERISLYRPDTVNRRSSAWRQVQIRTPAIGDAASSEGLRHVIRANNVPDLPYTCRWIGGELPQREREEAPARSRQGRRFDGVWAQG
ncbi:hypothetical protein [Micromonospora sp. LOL_021]|uniref:hypothetical protein n=1 Tax=Micromonospora sp. LOL_021 TaxID=3345417 RepID=UPI003A87CFA1